MEYGTAGPKKLSRKRDPKTSKDPPPTIASACSIAEELVDEELFEESAIAGEYISLPHKHAALKPPYNRVLYNVR
jgi:hypothetical protein